MKQILKYLIFIIIGIILYIYINSYNTFSIGVIWRIPLGIIGILNEDNIDLTRAEQVTPLMLQNENFRYSPLNRIYFVDNNYYYYTDTNIDEMLTGGPIDETFIENINAQIREIQRTDSNRAIQNRQEIENMRANINRQRRIGRFSCSVINENV